MPLLPAARAASLPSRSKREKKMRLATARDGTADGRLVVIAPDGEGFAPAPVGTLQQALEQWDQVAAELAGIADFPQALDHAQLAAPLPRAWQWLDGSAFASHGALMDKVLGVEPLKTERPLMYQGVSDHFYGPHDDVRFPMRIWASISRANSA
jgi:fumarylacetoacetate (FAA) hydrolase